MKKFLFLVLFIITACSPQKKTIVGQDFHLIQPEPPMTITLKLDSDGRFYGKAINNYFGVYEIKEKNITFNLQGQTMMEGPLPHMEFESNYLKSLRTIQKYQLNKNQVILEGARIYVFESNAD